MHKQILITSLIQGLTEALPISSSGHLALWFFFNKLNIPNLDALLHLGSFFALIIFFYRFIFKLLKNFNYILMGKIIVGFLPVALAGIILNYFGWSNIKNLPIFFDFLIVGHAIAGGLLIYAHKKPQLMVINNYTTLQTLGFKQFFLLGVVQILALIPGISRSGILLTFLRCNNYCLKSSIFITFIFALLPLMAAGFVGLLHLYNNLMLPTSPKDTNFLFLLQAKYIIIILGLTAIFTLLGLLILNRFTNILKICGYYRMVLALLLLVGKMVL